MTHKPLFWLVVLPLISILFWAGLTRSASSALISGPEPQHAALQDTALQATASPEASPQPDAPTPTVRIRPTPSPLPRPPQQRNPGLVFGGIVIIAIILIGLLRFARLNRD